jgi:DNA-directed RNA polymerase subunit RPC12/RpoP
MGETIKCACTNCGAKYRIPVEAQGRTARCKRCGGKFEVPREQSLEDSILTWLTAPDEDEVEEAPAKPRIISMNTGDANEESMAGRRMRGTIRMKSTPPKEGSA